MRRFVLAALLSAALLSGLLGSATLLAQDAKGPDFQNFHAQCIGCHGIPGYKTAFPHVYHVPKIAGQQAGYIVAALKAYKSGDRSHPSMRGIAATLNEDQMKQLAEFYAGQGKQEDGK